MFTRHEVARGSSYRSAKREASSVEPVSERHVGSRASQPIEQAGNFSSDVPRRRQSGNRKVGGCRATRSGCHRYRRTKGLKRTRAVEGKGVTVRVDIGGGGT